MKDWLGKVIAIASVLAVVATVGANFPTKDAVSKMIAQESPYVKDQSLILHRLEQIERKVDKLLEADD